MPGAKRILFVDDEPNILSGLRRMLRSMRREWDMLFAAGGQEALDILNQKRIDVVVTDMRMPGMDGAELLQRVMERYPKTIRIVLSGQADRESILRVVGPIHQYLAKPCDADTLKSTLSRACVLDDLLSDEDLKCRITKMEALPSLPSLYEQVVGELQSPDVSATTLGELISKDMGMSAKVLQLVNSAFFGIRPHIPNPTQAVILLGLDTVKLLGLSASVFSQFDRQYLETLSLDTLWEHSVRVAAFAGQIAQAENLGQKDIDYAFIAGLLHDVGKLVLAANFPDKYKHVLEKTVQNNGDLLAAECEIWGATHSEVGAYLLGLWGLPEPVVNALIFHHKPDRNPQTGITPAAVLHVANALEYATSNRSHTGLSSTLNMEYLSELGLSHRIETWQDLCRRAEKENK